MVFPWLFYAVPSTNPGGLETVFTDRFWDDAEGFIPAGVGVVPGSTKPYFGVVPARNETLNPRVDPDWFLHGIPLDEYELQKGAIACVTLTNGTKPRRGRMEIKPGRTQFDGPGACNVPNTSTPLYNPPCIMQYNVIASTTHPLTLQQGYCKWIAATGRWSSAPIPPVIDGGLTMTFRPVGAVVNLQGYVNLNGQNAVPSNLPPFRATWSRRIGITTYTANLQDGGLF